MWEAPTVWLGPRPLMVVRRCPTLPHPPGCSTIGAVGLSFRVRNGTGRFPHAMTAVTLCPCTRGACSVGGEICVVTTCFCRFSGSGGVVLFSCVVPATVTRWWVVGWEPHSGRVQNVFLCGVSCWPISTGQLHESLVLASTSGLSTQWSGWGPLTHKVCMEISSRSELPA